MGGTDIIKYVYCGGVPEWTNGAVLKTVEGAEPSVGSNPTPSAIVFYTKFVQPPQEAVLPVAPLRGQSLKDI